MHRPSVPQAGGFLLLCFLAIVAGVSIAPAYTPTSSEFCNNNLQCKDQGQPFSADCLGTGNGDCDMSGITDQIWLCDTPSTLKCGVIGPPPMPIPCKGVCVADNSIGCTVNYNKCQTVNQ